MRIWTDGDRIYQIKDEEEPEKDWFSIDCAKCCLQARYFDEQTPLCSAHFWKAVFYVPKKVDIRDKIKVTGKKAASPHEYIWIGDNNLDLI